MPFSPLLRRLLSALPGEVEHFAEKESRQIKEVEQILIAEVFNFGGICSSRCSNPMPLFGCRQVNPHVSSWAFLADFQGLHDALPGPSRRFWQ
jgi:hypothetical protein